MEVSHVRRSGWLHSFALVLALVVLPRAARSQQAASSLYVRTDSDHTVVIAPRLRVQAPPIAATRLTAIYAADVWTSASIDIRTSASKVPVTEQRDELDFSLDHELEDVTLTAAYRYSVEPDYVSHGVSGGFSYDFADNNSTLALGASGSGDHVGKAGDPHFSRSVGTLGARLSFTQVLSTGTLAQVMYDVSRIAGYQGSPYRYVAIGGGASCTSALDPLALLGSLCVPEVSPGLRLRHALGVELRQALGAAWSFGLAYRFYNDDWGVLSHTLRGELAVRVETDTLLAARYRGYGQAAAKHYRAQYVQLQSYVTSDKELSALTSQRGALELDHVFHFVGDATLTATVSGAAIYYAYRNFLPLDHILAFELNAAMVLVP